MEWIVWTGVAVTVVGILMLLRLILRANRLRKGGAEPGMLESELRRIIFLHGAAIGVAFLGLAIMIIGMVL